LIDSAPNSLNHRILSSKRDDDILFELNAKDLLDSLDNDDLFDGDDEFNLIALNKKEKAALLQDPKVRSRSKAKVARLTARARSGYIYSDEYGEYDVPILNQSMW
jgi:hypothetical protein